MERNTVERDMGDRKRRQKQNKRDRASSVRYVHRHKPPHPHHVKVSPRGRGLDFLFTTVQALQLYYSSHQAKQDLFWSGRQLREGETSG